MSPADASPTPSPAPSPRTGRPRARRRLLLALAGLLLLLLGFGVRHQARSHLIVMVRDPGAGVGACWSCHASGRPPRPLATEPPSPVALLALPDGELLASAERDGSLYRLDPASGSVPGRIDVGRRPQGMARTADGRILVALRGEDTLAVVSLDPPGVLARIPVGREPTGVAVVPGRPLALVANTGSDDVSLVDLAAGRERYRLVAGREPYAIAVAADGKRAVVANRLSGPHPPRTAPASELTVIELGERPRVTERRRLESLHLAEGVALTPDGQLALLGAVVAHDLLPTTQVARGWVSADALVAVELAPGGRTVPVLLDRADEYEADPAELLVAPDGQRAFLSVGGRDRVLVLSLARLRGWLSEADPATLAALGQELGPGTQLIEARLPTAANPRGLALSGGRLQVAERLADSIASFDLGRLRLAGRLELGQPGPPSLRRRGERLFFRATAFQHQFSCRTCHPDGHLDGLSYDFDLDGLGENVVDNRSLRGLAGTAPFKWTGLNPTLDAQCGPRFARMLSRLDAFPPADLAALAHFIQTIPPVNASRPRPSSPELELGRQLFFRTELADGQPIPVTNRCPTCHPAPSYTSQARSRIGTGGPGDGSDVFDAAHLLDLRDGAPYLHDGRAGNLYELFLRHNPDDRHGQTSDLTRLQLDALVEYLRTL